MPHALHKEGDYFRVPGNVNRIKEERLFCVGEFTTTGIPLDRISYEIEKTWGEKAYYSYEVVEGRGMVARVYDLIRPIRKKSSLAN